MLLKFSNLPSLFFDKDIAYTTTGTGYLSFPGTIIKEFSSSFIFEVHKEENKYILNEIEFKY